MNRRTNERIQMKLPCVLSFSGQWGRAFTGVTANMHRNGLLISCGPSDLPRELPQIRAKCVVQVELPVNHTFARKCVVCETTLLRIDVCSEDETRLAMQIESVIFRDLDESSAGQADLHSYTGSLPM